MTEARLQQECYEWFHNTYPDLRGLLCYNLNNSKNKIDGNQNKAKGLQPGRSDMVFYYNTKAHHIELKLPGGRQSKAQKEWQELIESQGFRYYIARTVDEFKSTINGILCH